MATWSVKQIPTYILAAISKDDLSLTEQWRKGSCFQNHSPWSVCHWTHCGQHFLTQAQRAGSLGVSFDGQYSFLLPYGLAIINAKKLGAFWWWCCMSRRHGESA